ncbi:DegV family protein [Weissella kandleri]|uniref:DegV family protein n=1 Tax=Weissella kandleri TaxID=1616 RepID=UPI00387E7D13
MAQVKIVTDSTAILSDEEIAQLDITVIPLTVVIDDVLYEDGVTLSREEFMEKMEEANNLPKTSTPAIGAFSDVYERLTADGSEIISIHLTPELSGTCQTAQQAAQLVSPDHIHVLNSAFIDRALSFQVIKAAKLAQMGASAADILSEIEKTKQNTQLYLTLDSLDNLSAGGRISKATGFIGGLLNIKIGAHVVDGDIIAEVKGRGAKTIRNYIDKIVDEMHATSGIEMIGLSHAGIPEKAAELGARLAQEFPEATISINQTSPVVATHTGAGAYGLSYLVKG